MNFPHEKFELLEAIEAYPVTAETKEAMREALTDESLPRFKTIEDLLQDLEAEDD